MNKPMIIGFVCQKGGVGKSTMLTLLANYLAYIKGRKILVVDTDSLQNTIYVNRSEDRTLLDSSEDIRASFDAQPYPLLYPVLRCDIENLHQFLTEQVLSLQDDYDYILVDTKGDLNQESVTSISIFNTVFIPTAVSDSSTKSASNTGHIMQKLIDAEKEEIELKEYFFFWSRMVYSSKTESEKNEFMQADFNAPYFSNRFLKNNQLERSIMKRGNLLYNTILFPAQNILKTECPELLLLLEEMYDIVETQKNQLSSK